MDEVNTTDREQRKHDQLAPPEYERRHGWKDRNGTWEALASPVSPDIPLGKNRRRALL